MYNVYYNPEHYGLTTVGAGSEEDLCYEFNLFVVWKDANNRYYWQSDAGCSCPSPFESYNSLDSLISGSKEDALNDLKVWIGNDSSKKNGSDYLLNVLSAKRSF